MDDTSIGSGTLDSAELIVGIGLKAATAEKVRPSKDSRSSKPGSHSVLPQRVRSIQRKQTMQTSFGLTANENRSAREAPNISKSEPRGAANTKENNRKSPKKQSHVGKKRAHVPKVSKQTQHPPDFVVRHLNPLEIYKEAENLPVKLLRKPASSHTPVDRTHSPGRETSQRGNSISISSPTAKRKLVESQFDSSTNRRKAVQEFELQKSDILRCIQRLKAQFPSHISSPFRKTAIPHSPTKFKSLELGVSKSNQKNRSAAAAKEHVPPRGSSPRALSPTSSHSRLKIQTRSMHSVRPPSALKTHRQHPQSPQSRLPLLHSSYSPQLSGTKKLGKSTVRPDGTSKVGSISVAEPFIDPLLHEAKRAFPMLEVESNPRRKRFRAELGKAWKESLDMGLAEY
ncbi:hypothetical protein BJ741DRAFT_644281 [Chytriomyces cf. hyalinus JEL632]|nr:hypothetical protein BJ741DRAFT_644281 [Chytriomyces cf. hyalinus JEL632]